MIKTIEEISIILNADSIFLTNSKNGSRFNYNSERGTMSFTDSNGNIVQNYGSTISINFEVFKLTHIGQTINRSNGNMIACLCDKDIRELAEQTFYEVGQVRVYDFINLKFNVEL